MHGVHVIEAGAHRFEIKLSAGAMYRIEEKSSDWSDDGDPLSIVDVLDSLEDFRMTVFAKIFAECLDAGRGVDVQEALNVVDAIGLPEAVKAFEKVAEMAFPEASADTGKTKATGLQPVKTTVA